MFLIFVLDNEYFIITGTTHMDSVKHYRTVWISDIHLGTKGCKAKHLLKFLKSFTCDYLFLVGDIIDLWAMKRGSKWTNHHNAVVQQILKISRHNTKVIYIPGNHDNAFREYVGMHIGNIQIHHDYIHTTTSGLKIYVTHGDEFDIITRYHKWIAVLGDIGYEFLLSVNTIFNNIRDRCGLGYWSLSAYIKQNVKNAVNFIGDYEQSVVNHAKHKEVDAVLCGHIHHAEFKQIDDIFYINTGDWVESLTAVVEEIDGKLTIINWVDTPVTL